MVRFIKVNAGKLAAILMVLLLWSLATRVHAGPIRNLIFGSHSAYDGGSCANGSCGVAVKVDVATVPATIAPAPVVVEAAPRLRGTTKTTVEKTRLHIFPLRHR